MTRLRPVLVLLIALLGLLLAQPRASAGTLPLTVSVGYADNSHCPQFDLITDPCVALFGPGGPDSANFPSPWQGSAEISQFIGVGVNGVAFDAGALLLTNTSGADVTVGNVNVTVGGSSFNNLWGSFTVPNGMSVILTQTAFDSTFVPNFDTSDVAGYNGGINNGVIPQIAITIGGQTITLFDINQILNTGGFDVGCTPPPPGSTQICVLTNESSPWSLIPDQTATPEPASILLLGSGLLSLGTFVRRKLRA